MKCLTKALKIVTELVKGIKSSLSEKNRKEGVRVYALTTECCDRSKSLHRMDEIFSYCVSNGTVKFKMQETSQRMSIMDTSDLEKLESNSMTVGMFCIAITREEIRVSAASRMDLFVIIFIGRKHLYIVIGGSVLGVAGIPILPLAIMQ